MNLLRLTKAVGITAGIVFAIFALALGSKIWPDFPATVAGIVLLVALTFGIYEWLEREGP